MAILIEKRDGRLVVFSKDKIVNAMSKAFFSTRKEFDSNFSDLSDSVSCYIERKALENNSKLNVEDIQDIIEHKLMCSQYKDVAKSYIKYRDHRSIERGRRSELVKNISEKIRAKNVQNQNANMDEKSFGGRMGEARNELMKDYALKYCMSEMSRNNHLENIIYIHDLDSYAVGMHNCMSMPLDDLLENGFITRQTDVRPAQSLNTAMQLVAVLFQLQSLQQFGGVSATHLDWTMVPYVRKSFTKHLADGMRYVEGKSEYKTERFWKWLKHDENHPDGLIHMDDGEFKSLHEPAWEYAMNMTEREACQAVEGLYHNLNTLQSRSGNQLPFTSINYGTCTLPEGRLITKVLLNVSIDGIGKLHRTPIFPCGIFQYMKGVNDKEGTPNYDLYRLALKSTAKRLYPNYANVDWSGNAGYDIDNPSTYFSTMGCRTANGVDINQEDPKLKQLKDGRGNLCPVTVILPKIAMIAKERAEEIHKDIVDVFFEILENKIEEAKDMLIERYHWLCMQSPDSARFMYENHVMYGYKEDEGIESALKHGTLSLGQLGLAETLQILIGCNHTKPEGMKLAKKIEGLFAKKCREYKKGYKLNFGVYYTPAENLCYTAMKKFKEEYGEIPNVSDRDYFTNSMHVPVWEKLSPFDKIDIESQLTGFSSAGCITYVELDGSVNRNIDALEQIVNYAMEKDVPYFAVNVPSDLCLDCGYQGEINDECPQCHSKNFQQLRRVTGYLTGNYLTAFNKGKQEEVHDRVKHANKLVDFEGKELEEKVNF